MQGRFFISGKGLILSMFSPEITTTSPFSISLTNFAPMISNAHVSEDKMNRFSSLPKINGRIPRGSLAPINLSSVNATNA